MLIKSLTMSKSLRICVIIIHQVSCIPIVVDLTSVLKTQNVTSSYNQNGTISRTDVAIDNHTTPLIIKHHDNASIAGYSKGSPTIFIRPTIQIENQTIQRSPEMEHHFTSNTSSLNMVTNKTTARDTNESPKLVSDLQIKATNHDISNATVPNANNTKIFFNSEQQAKVKLDYKLLIPNKRARYARSEDDQQNNNQSDLQPDGYAYDINHCQYIDDRVLCGYEKNPQEPKKKEVVDLDDLCRKHGDRIECGYIKGPFPDVYHLDPENDKIAKINLANYQNIARTNKDTSSENLPDSNVNNNGNKNEDDDVNNSKMALRANKVPRAIGSEMTEIMNSKHVQVAKENLQTKAPHLNLETLSQMLKSYSESEKRTLANLLKTDINLKQSDRETGKKCIEKDGRIFCRTVYL